MSEIGSGWPIGAEQCQGRRTISLQVTTFSASSQIVLILCANWSAFWLNLCFRFYTTLSMLQSINAFVTRLSAEYECARSGLGPLRLSGGQIFILFLQKALIDLVNKWNNASTTTRITSSVLFVLVFANVVERALGYFTSLSRRGFPVLERPKDCKKWDWKAKAKEGAEKFPDSPYLVHYNGIEQIVYPSSSLGEIKALPLHEASLMEYSTHCLFEGWPFLGHEIGALYGAVGVDLARSLPNRISDRQAVTEQAFGKFIGECKEWKSIRLYPSVQRLVGRISGTGLLGPELGGSSQWLGTFDAFIYSVVFAMFSISPIPKVFRPMLKYISFGPNYLMYWRLKNLAWPIAERDFRTYHASTADEKSKPKDTARFGVWLATRYRDEERSIDKIAHDFIVTMFESLPSTTVTLYFVLSELAIRPDLAEELRKEVMDSLVDGKLPASNLAELRKMDSFMREVTRTNIFSYRKSMDTQFWSGVSPNFV